MMIWHKRYTHFIAIYLVWIGAIFLATAKNLDLKHWLNGWHQWDAIWYKKIWDEGYGVDFKTLVFPPGYAWVTGGVSAGTGLSFDLAAMVIGLLSFFLATVVGTELLSKRFSIKPYPLFVAQLSFPAAFYAFMPYSDALFLLIFWGMIYFADREQTYENVFYLVLLSLLAPLIRITGYALTSLIVLKRWGVTAALITLSFIVWFNFEKTGDPFKFLHLQREFKMPEGHFIDGIVYTWLGLFELDKIANQAEFIIWIQSVVLPLVSSLFVVVGAFWLLKKRDWLLLLTVIAVAFMSRNQTYWRSVYRYDWPLVGIAIGAFFSWVNATGWFQKVTFRFFLALVLVLNFALQFYFARILHSGGWAF